MGEEWIDLVRLPERANDVLGVNMEVVAGDQVALVRRQLPMEDGGVIVRRVDRIDAHQGCRAARGNRGIVVELPAELQVL